MIESYKKKRIALIEFKKTVAIVMLFCLVVPAHAGMLSEALVETKQGTLNIRSGPGMEYPIIEKIPRGQSLHIIQSTSPWYEVQLDDGRQGYAFHQYLRLLDGYRLEKHRAGFMIVGMHVDEVYARLPENTLRLVNLSLEGMFTPALEVFDGASATQKPALVGEIAWRKRWIVSRISVYDERFKTECGIGVGSTIGDLKQCYTLDWADFGEDILLVRVEALGMSFSISDTPLPDGWEKSRDPYRLPEHLPITGIFIN